MTPGDFEWEWGGLIRNTERLGLRGAGSGNRGGSPSLPQTPEFHHSLRLKSLVRKGRQIRNTGCQVRDTGHRVDTAESSILVLLKVDTSRAKDGRVLIEEVIGTKQEAHSVPQSHCVGNILSLRDMQQASSHPSHQVLWKSGRAGSLWRQRPGPQPQPAQEEMAEGSAPGLLVATSSRNVAPSIPSNLCTEEGSQDTRIQPAFPPPNYAPLLRGFRC